ncbi:MAG: hypothetical protein JJT94_10180 [Bernardetiaceae bacterium]|nr:hypothetical protein [Bernardetiaceae bacterium]
MQTFLLIFVILFILKFCFFVYAIMSNRNPLDFIFAYRDYKREEAGRYLLNDLPEGIFVLPPGEEDPYQKRLKAMQKKQQGDD